MESNINKEMPEIIYMEDNLFLTCPKCKETAYLTFNRRNPELININCHKCQNNSQPYLNDYLQELSKYNPIELKCKNHNIFLNKYCYKCHIQFCSECDKDSHISCYPIKIIKKIITKERLEELQKIIKICKEDFKYYINTYINEHLIKQSNDTQDFIINALVRPYINNMISFFHFCDCAILNYNIEYPDFYQQMNLKEILSIFKEKINLINLNETNNIELIFSYQDNCYISKYRDKLLLLNTITNKDSLLDKSFTFNDEIKVLNKRDGIYITKKGENISTLSPHNKTVEFHKINDEIFAIVRKDSSKMTVIELFSTKYNKVISSRKYSRFYCIFNLEDNTRYGVASSYYIEINKLEDNNSQKISEIQINKIFSDIIDIPNNKYIAVLCSKEVEFYNKNDLTFFKNINLNEFGVYNHFYKDNDERILLGGYKIGLLDIKNWKFKILRDETINRFKNINYSDIVITYFNRIICKKSFKEIQGSTYDDVPNTVISDDNFVCILDFDPENNRTRLVQNNKNINPLNICLNEKNEILITCSNCVQVYNID